MFGAVALAALGLLGAPLSALWGLSIGAWASVDPTGPLWLGAVGSGVVTLAFAAVGLLNAVLAAMAAVRVVAGHPSAGLLLGVSAVGLLLAGNLPGALVAAALLVAR